MCHGDDNDCLLLRSRIPMSKKNGRTNIFEYLVLFLWLQMGRFDAANNTSQFIQELSPLPFDLLIEPCDGFIDFLLGDAEESDVH